MKSALLLALLGAQISFAAPIFCVGGKWSLQTNNNWTTATVQEDGNGVQFGDLSCETLTTPTFPQKSVLSCASSKPAADAGYDAKINLEVPGVDMKGSLTEQTIAGPRKVTDLNCVGAAN